jgi:hypothetical protein
MKGNALVGKPEGKRLLGIKNVVEWIILKLILGGRVGCCRLD